MNSNCSRCGIHPATTMVAESALDWAHGFYENLCICCAVYQRLEIARKAAARIPDLEKELASACDEKGEPPPEIPFGWEGYEDVHSEPKLRFWAEDLGEVIAWVKAQPGRSVGGRVRCPEYIVRRSPDDRH